MTAIYYDVENMGEDAYVDNAIKSAMSLSENKNNLLQFAYADWGRIEDAIKELFVSSGVSMRQVVNARGYYGSFKNASDIALAIDATELALSNKSVSHFVLVSGDGGYISLVSKLKELGKEVTIVAIEKHLSRALICYAGKVVKLPHEVSTERKEKHEKYEPYQKTIWAILASNLDEDNDLIIDKILNNRTIVSKIRNNGLPIWKITSAIVTMNHKREDKYKISNIFKKHLESKLKEFGYKWKRVSGVKTIIPISEEKEKK